MSKGNLQYKIKIRAVKTHPGHVFNHSSTLCKITNRFTLDDKMLKDFQQVFKKTVDLNCVIQAETSR